MDVQKRAKLRVGVLLDTLTVPAWAYETLAAIVDSDFAGLTLAVVDDRPGPFPHLLRSPLSLLTTLYLKVDRQLFRYHQPDALATLDALPLLRDAATMTLRYNQAPAKQSHASLTAGTLPQHDLDVLIALAPVPLTIELRAAAKYGIWSCYSHASSCAESVCQGVWEVVHAVSVTDCYLRRFDAAGEAGLLMSRCYVASDRWSVSQSEHILLEDI